jgi:hypothetical protein
LKNCEWHKFLCGFPESIILVMANQGNRSGGQDSGREEKGRKGDTGRSSNQGRKESTGGSRSNESQGSRSDDNSRSGNNKTKK